jgi:hypothetical protein
MEPSNQHHEMHLSADLAGVKVNYEQENTDNHKIISVAGSIGGVNFQFVDSNSDNTTGQLNTEGTTGNGAELTGEDVMVVGDDYKITKADNGTTEGEVYAEDNNATDAGGALDGTATTAATVGTTFTASGTAKLTGDAEIDNLDTVRALTSLDGNDEQTIIISTNIGGMKLEYQQMESKSGTTSDGFFGTFADANLLEADGFGITTSLAGNTVQIRNYKTTAEAGDDVANDTALTAVATADTGDSTHAIAAADVERNTKIIVTRPLASGATAEFTYVTGDGTDTMDLEFRMAF